MKIAEFTYQLQVTSIKQIELLSQNLSNFVNNLDIEVEKKQEISEKIRKAIEPIIHEVIELTIKTSAPQLIQPDLKPEKEKIKKNAGRPKKKS